MGVSKIKFKKLRIRLNFNSLFFDLIHNKPHFNKSKSISNILTLVNRPKWHNQNSEKLYKIYFKDFQLNTSMHTLAYLSENLDPLYYQYLYENEYLTHYLKSASKSTSISSPLLT